MRSLEPEFARFEAEGTVFGSINKDDFHAIERAAPPRSVVQAFEAALFPIDQRIEVNESESRTLAAIRDALLPKLISGEIRTASDEVRSTNWERLAGEIQTTNDARRSTKREVRESNTGRSR